MAKLKPSANKKARHIRYRSENRREKNKARKMAHHLARFPDYKTPTPLVGKQPDKPLTGYIVVGQDEKGRDIFQLIGFDRPNGFYSNAAKKARPDFSIGARAFLKVA